MLPNLLCAGSIVAGPRNSFTRVELSRLCCPWPLGQGRPHSLHHCNQDELSAALRPGHIFIGQPVHEFVPSPWVSPFELFEDATFEGADFESYACKRSEKRKWLAPLAGRTLVCTCRRGNACHGWVILRMFDETMPSVQPLGTDPRPAPLEAHNCAHGAARVSPVNEEIISDVWGTVETFVRDCPVKVFWEVFAGSAVLTEAFARSGWVTAPPVDICINRVMDIMNPTVMSKVLSFILEGRVALLWLSPPHLSTKRGDALADAAGRLFVQQRKAKGAAVWETTSEPHADCSRHKKGETRVPHVHYFKRYVCVC